MFVRLDCMKEEFAVDSERSERLVRNQLSIYCDNGGFFGTWRRGDRTTAIYLHHFERLPISESSLRDVRLLHVIRTGDVPYDFDLQPEFEKLDALDEPALEEWVRRLAERIQRDVGPEWSVEVE